MSMKTLYLTLVLVLASGYSPALAADPNSVYLAGNTQIAANTISGTAGGTATIGRAPAPETTLPPNGDIDPKLVGMWSSGLSAVGDWFNAATGAYAYTSGNIEGIEFTAEGLFRYFRMMSGNIGNDQYVFYTLHNGNYRVEGNLIYCTNVRCKQTTNKNNKVFKEESFDYKLVDNQRLEFRWIDFFGEEQINFTNLDEFDNLITFQYNQKRVVD